MATFVNTITVSDPNMLTDVMNFSIATVSTAGKSEDFYGTLDGRDGSYFLLINNENGGSNVTLKTIAGDYVGAVSEECGYVTGGSIAIAYIDSAKFKHGKDIKFTLIPESSKSLNGTALAIVQYVPVSNN